jgi:integrase
MPVKELSKNVVDALKAPGSGNVVYWDSVVTGLGARITASGHVSFVYRYVISGRERRFTIGDYGQAPGLSVSAAREIVRKRRFTKDGRRLNPDDPLGTVEHDRAAKTVNELCDRFLDEHASRKRTFKAQKAVINRNIRPKLGKLKVAEVTYSHVDDLHRSLKARPYQANRVVGLLSKMMTLASTKWHYRTDNPCKGVERYHEDKRERYLSPDELQRLVAALAKHPNQQSANVARFLLLTGARRGEVLSATWDQFDPGQGIWTKPSAHTKQKKTHVVPLSAPAMVLLDSLGRGKPGEHLFPSRAGGNTPQTDLKRFWRTVCKSADIKSLRLHDLRHSFASILASSGASLPLIGSLLGHTQPGTTARYAHLMDDARRKAANTVGAIISAAETGREGADVVKLRKA